MGTVSWDLMVGVKEGQLETFRALMDEIVEHTRHEAGTLAYEWFVSDDGDAVHLYERYADSDAAMVHIAGFGQHLAERFLGAVDPTGFYVYGDTNEAVRGALGPMGAQFMGTFGGFAR